jgi:hypothetical protein
MLVASLGIAADESWGSGLFTAATLVTSIFMLIAFGWLAKTRQWRVETAVALYDPATMEPMPADQIKTRSYVPADKQRAMPSHVYMAVTPLTVIQRHPLEPGEERTVPIAFTDDAPVAKRPSPEIVPPHAAADYDAASQAVAETRFEMPEFSEDSSTM